MNIHETAFLSRFADGIGSNRCNINTVSNEPTDSEMVLRLLVRIDELEAENKKLNWELSERCKACEPQELK